jgi:hypothetical protein
LRSIVIICHCIHLDASHDEIFQWLHWSSLYYVLQPHALEGAITEASERRNLSLRLDSGTRHMAPKRETLK